MEQRIDRIEKAIEEMVESRKNDKAIIERLDKSIARYDEAIARHDDSLARHDKILANLEANQIIIGKAVEGIREDMGKMARAMNEFIDAVGYKLKDHEERINKLEK